MGKRLTDEDEILFRQIHPSFVEKDGQPSSQPFHPMDKDDNKLSVDRSTITDAAAAFGLYIANGHKSAAVYGLSVGEFEEYNLPCVSDPLEATDHQASNPAHAYADFSQHGTNKQKTLAKRLKVKALARGRLHPCGT
jgi:hypothetical protein